MATAASVPKKRSDLVLAHVQEGLYKRLVRMWRASGCGLDFHRWLAQRVEVDIVIPDFNASLIVGVNARPAPAPKPDRKRRSDLKLTDEEREEIKAAVVAGTIRNDSPIALLAAEDES